MKGCGVPSCWYCGGCPDAEDHQQPRSRGGSDDPSNIVDSCTTCNSAKGPKTLEEFRQTVARLNDMDLEKVQFHGEGGRTFAIIRVRDAGRVEVPPELAERTRCVVSALGVQIAARQLRVSNGALTQLIAGMPVFQTTIASIYDCLPHAERCAKVLSVDIDELIAAVEAIEMSTRILNSFERLREVIERMKHHAKWGDLPLIAAHEIDPLPEHIE